MKHLIPLLLAVIAFPLMANAQSRYTPSELDTLVATIALYPDPLLVHVLDASVHVDEIPSASAFANANRKLKGDDLAYAIERAELEYDEAVVALIPFPEVLQKMSKYATWTKQLGEAVEMQKADVMDAVQRMRRVAEKNGYLKSDDKVYVKVDENVSINPVREEYVYVPEYDPRVVYYVVSDGHVRIRYVNGAWIGAGLVYWGWDPFEYDWIHRRLHYRHSHRHMPPPRRFSKQPRHERVKNPPPPPVRNNSVWDRRPAAPPPVHHNSSWDRRPAAAQPSNGLRKTTESAPPPSNYKRPTPPPPPPQASSSDSDNQDSRWNNRSHRSERHHNPPAPPPSRRGDHGRR